MNVGLKVTRNDYIRFREDYEHQEELRKYEFPIEPVEIIVMENATDRLRQHWVQWKSDDHRTHWRQLYDKLNLQWL